MQINVDAIKNTRKFLLFKRPSASRPIISPKLALVPALGGGVFGNEKLNRPNAADTPAAIRKVCSRVPFFSSASQPMSKPATIQPIVPHNLIKENSFSGLFICLKEIAFTNASVGI